MQRAQNPCQNQEVKSERPDWVLQLKFLNNLLKVSETLHGFLSTATSDSADQGWVQLNLPPPRASSISVIPTLFLRGGGLNLEMLRSYS